MTRKLSVPGHNMRRALAVRMAIEDKIKTTIPERIADLIESLTDKKDKLDGYLSLLPYCYPRLAIQALVEASELGVETNDSLKEKEQEYLKLLKEENELRSAG